MLNSDLIEFLATNKLLAAQFYNLVIEDLSQRLPKEELECSQPLLVYFEYKIKNLLLPVIQKLQSGRPAAAAELF